MARAAMTPARPSEARPIHQVLVRAAGSEPAAASAAAFVAAVAPAAGVDVSGCSAMTAIVSQPPAASRRTGRPAPAGRGRPGGAARAVPHA